MKTYLIGGAVRDHLLNVPIKDRDYVIVGASQSDIANLFKQGFSQVGKDFPVFLHPNTGEEYALARVERKTGTGYHGFSCDTENVSLAEDQARRDLTINSIAMDESTGEIFDAFNGVQDLQNKVLRHTTAAFAEDPLRVLRLARFYARYSDFIIADETVELCSKMILSGELSTLNTNRVHVEVLKAFSEQKPERFVQALKMFADMKKYPQSITNLFNGNIVDVVGKSSEVKLVYFVLRTKGSGDFKFNSRMDALKVALNKVKDAPLADFYLHMVSNDMQMVSDASEIFPEVFEKREKLLAINASFFPQLQGKELGAAIKMARMKELT